MAKKSGKKRRGGRKGGYHGYVKAARGMFAGKVPLTLTYIAGGAMVDVFNIAPTQRASLFRGLTMMMKAYGMNYQVDGYTIAGALLILKGLAAVWPAAGVRINAFLSGFGMRL